MGQEGDIRGLQPRVLRCEQRAPLLVRRLRVQGHREGHVRAVRGLHAAAGAAVAPAAGLILKRRCSCGERSAVHVVWGDRMSQGRRRTKGTASTLETAGCVSCVSVCTSVMILNYKF